MQRLTPVACYLATSLCVFIGWYFAYALPVDQGASRWTNETLVDMANRWDAGHYNDLVQHGYTYDPSRRSNVAFFPLYPLMARVVANVLGCRSQLALLIVAQLSLLGCFLALADYTRQRFSHRPELIVFILFAFGLFPMGVFFRAAYTESTFLFFCLMCFVTMVRRWPLLVVCLFSALATATRSTGVALLLPIAWHVWSYPTAKTTLSRIGTLAAVIPLAGAGLIAFMIFQQIQFGDCLAFAKVQDYWSFRPGAAFDTKVWSLLTLEPAWGVYFGAGDWQRVGEPWLFCCLFWNPLIFLLVCLGVLIGWWTDWLDTRELLLAAGLIAMPYGLRGYDCWMGSMGRFMLPVFPFYLVIGRLLARGPAWLAPAVFCVFASLLTLWSVMFAGRFYFW